MLSVLYQLSRNYQKQESHLQSRYLSQYCIAKSILYRYVCVGMRYFVIVMYSVCVCVLQPYYLTCNTCYSCQDDGVQSAMTYHDVTRLQAVYNLLSLYMHNDSNNGNCSEMLRCEKHDISYLCMHTVNLVHQNFKHDFFVVHICYPIMSQCT